MFKNTTQLRNFKPERKFVFNWIDDNKSSDK